MYCLKDELYIRLFYATPGGFLFPRLDHFYMVCRAFLVSLSTFFWAANPFMFLSYHAQCNSGIYTCFFLSPFVYSHFTALFSSSLYLLFAALFQYRGGWLRASSQKKFSLSPLCNNLCAILWFFKRSGPRCLLSALHNNDEGSRSGTRVSHINYSMFSILSLHGTLL